MIELFKSSDGLPPLPDYTLKPAPPLVPPIPDKYMAVIAPFVFYWVVSMFFHWIDVNDYFPQYRLHTPAELLKRNHVTRWEVVRDVFIQQLIQTVVGILLGMTEPDDMVGKEEYDVAVWAQRIRIGQRVVPGLLALVGINAKPLAERLAVPYPALSTIIAGGANASSVTFASWETLLAKAVYWFFIPALQYALGIVFVDTWQYFLHRLMHVNRWMYTTFHSRHHRLYVPYAFGALYNHPFEGFLLDILGASLAFKAAGMNSRQGTYFFTGSTIKTVDDHCGYALPWDPLQRLTGNNAAYHDIHHQSFGIKSNFSQPFFTFWDRILETKWTGGDVSARYERQKAAAQKKLEADQQGAPVPASALAEDPPAPEVLNVDPRIPTESQKENRSTPRKGNRRRTASSLTQSESLRGLRERVSIHGRTGGILGMDHSH